MKNRTYIGFDGQRYNSVGDLYEANQRWAEQNKNNSGIVFVGLDGGNYYSIEEVLEANSKFNKNEGLERKVNRR